MRSFQTRDAAARSVGRRRGIKGGVGGWLYKTSKGKRVKLMRGWNAYGRFLEHGGIILYVGGKWVVAEDWKAAEKKADAKPKRAPRGIPAWRRELAEDLAARNPGAVP